MSRDRFLQEERAVYEALVPRTRSFPMFASVTLHDLHPALFFSLEVDIMTFVRLGRSGQRGLLSIARV